MATGGISETGCRGSAAAVDLSQCGRRFVTANLWHSCYVGSVDDFFVNHAELRPLFDAYVPFVETIGPFTVEVVNTRISL